MDDNNRLHTYLYSKTVSMKFECIHNLIAIEGPGYVEGLHWHRRSGEGGCGKTLLS